MHLWDLSQVTKVGFSLCVKGRLTNSKDNGVKKAQSLSHSFSLQGNAGEGLEYGSAMLASKVYHFIDACKEGAGLWCYTIAEAS